MLGSPVLRVRRYDDHPAKFVRGRHGHCPQEIKLDRVQPSVQRCPRAAKPRRSGWSAMRLNVAANEMYSAVAHQAVASTGRAWYGARSLPNPPLVRPSGSLPRNRRGVPGRACWLARAPRSVGVSLAEPWQRTRPSVRPGFGRTWPGSGFRMRAIGFVITVLRAYLRYKENSTIILRIQAPTGLLPLSNIGVKHEQRPRPHGLPPP